MRKSKQFQFAAEDAVDPSRKAMDNLVTAVLWAVYLYLWVPLISLIAWIVGFEFAYDVMVRTGGARNIMPTLIEYSVVVLCILSAYTIWSVGNRLRFRGKSRRTLRPAVTAEETAADFGISIHELAKIRNRRIMRIAVDDGGSPTVLPDLSEDIFDDAWPLADEEVATLVSEQEGGFAAS